MPPVDLEKEREHAIADILGPQRGTSGQEGEEAQESDDSGTTDYETDSDLTTDTEAEAPNQKNKVAAALGPSQAHDTTREGACSKDDSSSSGFSSEDSESEAPLKKSKS